MFVDREKLLNTMGHFTWMFGKEFFIETEFGNFVWLDPDYAGDNTITLYNGTYKDFLTKTVKTDFGRDKGHHLIRKYCGEQITLVIPQIA